MCQENLKKTQNSGRLSWKNHQKSSSRVGAVHIRENDTQKNVFLYEVFKSSFWCFFMFFQEELAWKPARQICNLQVKLSIVMVYVQNWTPTKVLKKHEKTWKY